MHTRSRLKLQVEVALRENEHDTAAIVQRLLNTRNTHKDLNYPEGKINLM